MGATNDSYGGNKTFLKLKAKTSETDPKPGFFKSEKRGDTWITTESFNAVTGELVKIQHTEYEYEGQKKPKCIMLFRDPDGSETQVDANFSGLLYSILNPMCNLAVFDGLKISVWLGKPRDNGKQWPSAGLTQHEEKVEWMYKPEVLPKVASEVYKGQVIKDDSEVVEFWKNRIEEINQKAQAWVQNPAKKDAAEKKEWVNTNDSNRDTSFEVENLPEDDLPF
jgi:hypothetical protein